MSEFSLFATACALIATIILAVVVIFQGNAIRDLESRMQELNCVHYIYEDGDAEHVDAEVALDCLRRHLGESWSETELP